jgi:hypothetical protein
MTSSQGAPDSSVLAEVKRSTQLRKSELEDYAMSDAKQPAPQNAVVNGDLTEEEISDVSLATFHAFEKENAPAGQLNQRRTRKNPGGGCGCSHGCGG